MNFSDLRKKEVINVCDGRRMGCICDIIIDVNNCRLEAIVVPGCFSFSNLFQKQRNIIVPWNKIRKLGDDVIIVDVPVNTHCGYN
ncbi:MAG: YlmC/YmxH family sporulation protein [Clostridia bacterium]|nr:YlmC/YmxH family sporulation protein [Clostridia bacterium]